MLFDLVYCPVQTRRSHTVQRTIYSTVPLRSSRNRSLFVGKIGRASCRERVFAIKSRAPSKCIFKNNSFTSGYLRNQTRLAGLESQRATALTGEWIVYAHRYRSKHATRANWETRQSVAQQPDKANQEHNIAPYSWRDLIAKSLKQTG